ncbi:RRQRL motif-containing zinc-binding protein [Nocardia abscessus]|uniref:RRQRL motif-containing zinc-binding protein n=1 Tax=Nocardia abscessus TaxID=120957 RepID=UPI002454CFE2|nr:RRQRL motif-containing zinc-binding protein [Nocardia abscessus]
MTTAEPQDGGIPIYEWRTAPAHLRTRRQLAAEGLRPNGQDIAAKLHRSRGRSREPMVAHLFDVNLAARKRPASPAQLEALAKATREHQLRAAERHGVDRAEIEQAGDPGPGWNTVTSALADYRASSSSALADYRPGSSLAETFSRDTEREGCDR